MGSRLGVIVKDASGWEIYYNHAAAWRIGADIALDGFEATLSCVRDMTPMGVDTPQKWTGATWIEGTLLIDLTTQTVIWAEESEGLYLPRLINALTEHTWPGWTAVWSSEGTRGVLAAAGVDPSTLSTSTGHTTTAVDDSAGFALGGRLRGSDMFSVALEDSRLVSWQADGYLEGIAGLGSNNMRHVALRMFERSAAGECLVWDDKSSDKRPLKGIHIDYGTRTLRWWSLIDEGGMQEEFAALWPGWVVESMGDNYEWHENILDRGLRDWHEDVSAFYEELAERIMVGRRPAPEGVRLDPMVVVAKYLTRMGHGGPIDTPRQLIPADIAAVLDLLEEFASSDPLPPARYIDHRGVIHPPGRR